MPAAEGTTCGPDMVRNGLLIYIKDHSSQNVILLLSILTISILLSQTKSFHLRIKILKEL